MEQSVLNFRQRFVSDYNLPIQVLDSPYFEQRLELLEPLYKAKSKYENVIQLLNEKFEGNHNKFLMEFYNIRENIIQDILHNEAYLNFNSSTYNMKQYAFKAEYPKKQIYSGDMIGKVLLSVDLKKANYQALRYVNKDIVFGTNSYEELIKKYTDLDYVINSKYTRQVVFGKLNPSRQITVEKYLMHLIHNIILDNFDKKHDLNIICLNTDELVYEVIGKYDELQNNMENIIHCVKDYLDINIKCEIFVLNTINFLLSNKSNLTIFHRKNLVNNEYKLMSCPMTYLPQIIRILNNEEIKDEDLVFYYEHNLSKFLYPLTLDKENSSLFKNKEL